MIAIHTPFGAEALQKRLVGSLGLAPGDVVVLEADGTGAPRASVLVVSVVDRDRLAKVLNPRIEWVHVLGTGVDGFPFDLLGDRILTCSRGANAGPIAEYVLAAMLSFEKRMPEIWMSGRAEFREHALGQLSGKTLGLIGLGAIGTATASRAIAFDMDVVAVRRTRAGSPITDVTVVPALGGALSVSDHLVVAAPATSATENLIDKSAFSQMKRGVHLVNVSRGSLVDQDALIAALEDGTVGMATLDVTDPEPLPEGHPLYSHPRVRVSPHVSWSAPDTLRRTIEMFEENFRRHVTHRPLNGVVDTAAGY